MGGALGTLKLCITASRLVQKFSAAFNLITAITSKHAGNTQHKAAKRCIDQLSSEYSVSASAPTLQSGK